MPKYYGEDCSYTLHNGSRWVFFVFYINIMLPLKLGLPSLGVYEVCLIIPTTKGKGFLYFASKCMQVYNLLPHHYWQGFFALDCYPVTSNEAKMLQPKMGLPSLGVAFSQARYSLVKDSYPTRSIVK